MSDLIKDKDQFFKSLGYMRHTQGYGGKGYYFIVGGYDLTKRQADAIWKAVQAQKVAHADMVIGETREYMKLSKCPECGDYQYSCTCASAQEILQVRQRERNVV